MYNRYIRNDNGGYTRVPQEESNRSSLQSTRAETPHQKEQDQFPSFISTSSSSAEHSGNLSSSKNPSGIFRSLMNQLKLDRIDTADLLLLGFLFFLFRENADEELLIALGLLLIL